MRQPSPAEPASFGRHALGADLESECILPFFDHRIPKLKGLAAFAAEYGAEFHRVEAISKLGDQTRVLDLTDPHVRAAVLAADDAKALYESHEAGDY